ncbi:Kinesin light chain [Morus notabilis]|uniref:Kinesin light chain n=1 Tax=Morus notabilis TaxID=981085 RepID=W9RKQ7_9ROSA|nr:Kinesin light chain [Morus notabilis]
MEVVLRIIIGVSITVILIVCGLFSLQMQGKLKEAEGFFLSALQEAKEGFGERDPHVASACNNLAELYRVIKAFDKAEPLYLEAINILEETVGRDDIRVGSALHNLGQFYLVQRKLEEARNFYEIKGRVLGLSHTDYADTMYHLGMVLYLQGKEKDAEALILDSIRILEERGQEESILYLRRLRYLAQGWSSLETINAAEGLALTLQAAGNLKEAQELLERCLDARKTLLPDDHIQIGENMLHIARLGMLKANRLRKTDTSEAIAELDRAKDRLNDSIRIAQIFLDKLMKQRGKRQSESEGAKKNGREALVILLQSFDALGFLEITKKELRELTDGHSSVVEAENALLRCISAYKRFGTERSISDAREVKAEYLSCLKHLASLISDNATDRTQQSRGINLQDINEEIKRLEAEVSPRRKRN